MARFLTIIAVAILLASGAAAQTGGDDEGVEARADAAIKNLRELIRNRSGLETELAELTTADAPADEEGQTALAERVEALKRDVEALNLQIGAVAAGVSEDQFRSDEGSAFDLNAELQALAEPFVTMLRDATENARQIERLRRALSEARRREVLARQALDALAPVRSAASDEALITALEEMQATWARRADAAADLANALDQQLLDRQSDRGATRAAANAAASGFFRDRGLSLLYGIGAFVTVFFVMRLIHRAASWLRVRRGVRRNFSTRLSNLVFSAFTVAAAIGAMLVVFNARNDWLLLGVGAVMLLALAWVGIKMLPGAIEQITLLLNLGAVQEGERVVIDDVPYRVKKLDFYTDFENPRLEGSEYALPVRALIGMRSRPAGPDEPWFPTRKNDWVRLADEQYGRIVSQSPEVVEIEIPGGSRVSYATGEFLGQTPENLSGGFRAEIVFGLSYRHQAELTREVMDKLKAHISEGIGALVPAGHLRAVGVEMLEAGDSAVNFEVEADLVGAAAPVLEEVERELTRLCVDACNKFGWEIPFPQMVVHRA